MRKTKRAIDLIIFCLFLSGAIYFLDRKKAVITFHTHSFYIDTPLYIFQYIL
jgi:hypothetical protein